ncbi:hypothetical protein E3N88_02933 [Mikania micrantha]|uniref:Uncharacterized protein n=1 Tax=Mikania micrantha TaxID=192012 RepID=A0A5N6Q7P1_9ASTR|nr:hypothetical protein E3N88_02933 [Mikania micrantha]
MVSELRNKRARAATLETKFCNITLSACSSVDDYCQKLSDLANQLADVDQPVSESRLVLQLVRGLPNEYRTTAPLINQQGVDWDQAISILKDEVIRLEAQPNTQTTVLAAPVAPAVQPSQHTTAHNYSPSDNSIPSRGRGRGRHNNWNRRGGRGRGSGRYQPNPCAEIETAHTETY